MKNVKNESGKKAISIKLWHTHVDIYYLLSVKVFVTECTFYGLSFELKFMQRYTHWSVKKQEDHTNEGNLKLFWREGGLFFVPYSFEWRTVLETLTVFYYSISVYRGRVSELYTMLNNVHHINAMSEIIKYHI